MPLVHWQCPGQRWSVMARSCHSIVTYCDIVQFWFIHWSWFQKRQRETAHESRWIHMNLIKEYKVRMRLLRCFGTSWYHPYTTQVTRLSEGWLAHQRPAVQGRLCHCRALVASSFVHRCEVSRRIWLSWHSFMPGSNGHVQSSKRGQCPAIRCEFGPCNWHCGLRPNTLTIWNLWFTKLATETGGHDGNPFDSVQSQLILMKNQKSVSAYTRQ